MPAPTALLKKEAPPPAAGIPLPQPDQDEDLLLDSAAEAPTLSIAEPSTAAEGEAQDVEMDLDEESRPRFAAAKDVEVAERRETRKIPIPPHRMSPLKASWSKIYTPLVENLKLQVRMNVKTKSVELRTSRHTESTGAIQQAEDFVRAFALGFDVDDAVAILRLEGIYVQTFEVKDVKSLEGDHLARAIGRIAGKDGRTKFAIENATRTRICVAGSRVSILGGFKEIGMARESIVSLILGKPPGKVYGGLRTISARMKERF